MLVYPTAKKFGLFREAATAAWGAEIERRQRLDPSLLIEALVIPPPLLSYAGRARAFPVRAVLRH